MKGSPPNSSMVIWASCKPQPVAVTAQHSFKVENAPAGIWTQDITSATVKMRAGRAAGLQFVRPDGSTSHLVAYHGIGQLKPGSLTRLWHTAVRKVTGRPAGKEQVETRVTFQAITLPGRSLPAGTGATPMNFAIDVRTA